MKKILAHLRRNSIQRKLLTAVSVLIFASSILVISLGHVRFSFDYSRQAAEDMQQLIEQVALNVDTYLDELARLCLSPYYSADIMEQLESEPATGQELLDKRREIENYLRQEEISTAQIQQAAPDSGYLTKTLNRTSYLLNAQVVSTTGWRVIAVNSVPEITKSAKATLFFNMILAILLAGAGVLISAYYVKKLLKPLYQTVKLMNQVQAGNLSVRAELQGTDEIVYLDTAFNRMLEQIQNMLLQEKQLTKQVYEAKFLQKQAQFDALYHQIQPHFLFNTLNTISLLIKCGHNAEAISGIDQLAVLLRGMTNANREIDLKSELKITESYLHLQKLRHDDLTYEIHAEGINLSYLLPALTIQPLVENALIHGCEAKSGKIVISIRLTTQDEYLSVSVQDNGIGMEPEALSALQAKLACCDDPGLERNDAGNIGLVNIQRRIHLKFGSQYGVQIISEAGSGTTATLLLPRRE